METLKPLSSKILSVLKEHQQNRADELNCLDCTKSCCSQAGFAILDNVILIYDKYKNGSLEREDYAFKKDLSFKDFVSSYFDTYIYETGKWFWKKELLVFHVKSLALNDETISIPASLGSYWPVRSQLFEENPWLNKGCVFLNKKIKIGEENETAVRRCICILLTTKTSLLQNPSIAFFLCVKAHVNPESQLEKLRENGFMLWLVHFQIAGKDLRN